MKCNRRALKPYIGRKVWIWMGKVDSDGYDLLTDIVLISIKGRWLIGSNPDNSSTIRLVNIDMVGYIDENLLDDEKEELHVFVKKITDGGFNDLK